MHIRVVVIVGLLLVVGLFACKKDQTDETPVAEVPMLKLECRPFFGADTLLLDSVYTLNDGTEIKITDVKFYLSDLMCGTKLLKDYTLFDYRNDGFEVLKVPGNHSEYSSLNGIVGVPSSVNHNDPSAFSMGSDLNIANAGDMHWDWNPGYIFIKIEGKADTIQNGIANFDHLLVYHVGLDENASAIQFSTLNWIQSSNLLHVAKLKLDIKNIIDHPTQPINVRNEAFTHSGIQQAALTEKVRSNFLNSLIAE
jgi:hypothetical protein